MRSLSAVPWLLAGVAAQGTSLNSTRSLNLIPTHAPSSTGNATLTKSPSGPIQTDHACAQVSSYVANTTSQIPNVEAKLAMACLKSVPISQTDAAETIEALKKMVQFQSTLAYLKDPPKGYPNEKVDILAGLDDIAKKVQGGYQNEYDFEKDIAILLGKAFDGHLGFLGMAFSGAFQWRRSSQIALISASQDGKELPKVWAFGDFNRSSSEFQPSPVTKINNQEIGSFMAEEQKFSYYQDADTRYNAQFFMQSKETFGYFTSPLFYPGPETSITYQNGTTHNYTNLAIVAEPDAWKNITSGASFYDTYIAPPTNSTGNSTGVDKRDSNALPRHLEIPRDREFLSPYTAQDDSLPLLYPEPSVASSREDVKVGGYFVNTPQGQIGILVVQSYYTKDLNGTLEFQHMVQQFIADAKSRNVTKVIIDTRSNGGGKYLLGYDLFLQFFPSQKPQTQSRWRGHQASELIGELVSSLDSFSAENSSLFVSPFSNDAWLKSDLTPLPDWKAMYPPDKFKGDNFTTLLKYNLSNPLQTSDTQFSFGLTPTGYGSRSNFTKDPFRAEDLILLSDGICASTCSILFELMVQQMGVRSLAIGGRPQLGPMVPVGGTKGTLTLPSTFLQALANDVITLFANSTQQARDWEAFMPTPFSIQVSAAAVNFQDNIRVGREKEGLPTQFVQDTASCRIWYEPHMYLNVTKVWEKTAAVAFGGNKGGLDESQCIAGSVTSRDQQTGRGEGNSTGSGLGNGLQGTGAAAGLKPTLSAVMACAVIVIARFAAI